MGFKFNLWDWFQDTWDKIVGKAVTRLTEADGRPGLSWEDVRLTAEYIRQAEVNFGTGAERREWVLEQIQKVRNIVLPHLIELLFWTALNYANQKKWIRLGESNIDAG